MDEDKNRTPNAVSRHLPVADAEFRPGDSNCNKKRAYFTKRDHVHLNRKAGVKTNIPNCSAGSKLIRRQSKTECRSANDNHLPRRYPQNSQYSVHLKGLLNDDNTFSSKNVKVPDNEYSFKSNEHNGAIPKQTVTCMSLSSLQDLIEKSADDILHAILNKESGFIQVLEESFNKDCIACVLLALGKAVSSDKNKDVSVMLNMISGSNSLFLVNVQQYLVTFQTYALDGFHLNAVVGFIKFLLKFQICLPSNACDVSIMLLPLLKETCENHLRQNKEMYSVCVEMLQELEEINSSILNKYTLNQIKETSRNERLQLLDPPEDYRSIPVLPDEVDMQMPYVFLRPSVIKGHYQNTEHYLDVQYRLLREDYVRPLREGIAEYLTLKDRNKSLKQIKDIKVYPNVQIIKQEFVNGELLHMIYIDDQKFAKIKWEFSKRLLSKSLLCLSSDNFQTMLFATVAKRDPEELVKGLLFLRFEDLTDEVLNLDPSTNFVVIETSAFFEAYRYNLDALLELKDDTLPMKRYIVDTQKTVLKPQYLDDNVTYDMRSVCLPLGESCLKIPLRERRNIVEEAYYGYDGHSEDDDYKSSSSDEDDYYKRYISDESDDYSEEDVVEDSYDDLYPQGISERLKNVTVLSSSFWPTCEDLNLDPSQYAALKAALTKEFTIIQGPTRKPCRRNPSPILVVCYTNHALDQFLEGILNFTREIVRVGGRGTNEAISRFQINNLKRNMRQDLEFLFDRSRGIMSELDLLKESVDEIKESIENSFISILSEEVLKNCMTSAHYHSLKSKMRSSGNILIYQWLLGIQVQESRTMRYAAFRWNSLNTHSFLPDEEQNSAETNADSEGEADIEHIEAQRDINPDEFAGASYDIPLYKDKMESIIMLEDGWQFVGGKQGLKDYIHACLTCTTAMSVKMAKQIKDVWTLTCELKWSLYKFWLEGYIRKKKERITELHQEIREKYSELQEVRTQEDIHVCKQALVIGMTTTGAAKYRRIVQHLNPRIVIVEEAAEILESHIVTSLAPDTQHLILIGDHQQLRPSPTVHLLATKYGMNISLFERMVENGLDCHRLEIQHRMRPEIASLLVPHIYAKLQNHESVKTFENIKGVSKNVFFVNHSYHERQENDSKSKVNVHEANFMLKFCKYLINQGYKPSQITVLTTYSGQLFEFKRSPLKSALQGIKFTVVDNYQGEENDIILISFVRSNEEGQIGFLKISNRVCVALSRAKKGLYCIGNFDLLAEKSNLWKNIIETLKDNNAIGPSLLLFCQNHPTISKAVTDVTDFDFVPEGGCTQQCEFRLSCGHLCSLKCHPYDPRHEDIQCPKPCTEKCIEGHLCAMKCYEDCPPCPVIVSDTIPICGHTIQVACHLKGETPCTDPCEKLLPCGHKCHRKCGESCTLKCFVKIPIQSSVCGHEVNIECSRSKDTEVIMVRCKEPCNAELPCGHKCSGTCGFCYQGRLHANCLEPCNRRLVCGHECKLLCYRNCIPCEQPCENYCMHKKCTKKCGEPCEKCTEPCEWACPHKKCTRLCGELCDRSVCNEPCPKVLKCEHPCIGVCGELCPAECRICDSEKLAEVCSAGEIETDVKFVCLEDCRHIFELNWFNMWISQENGSKNEIRFKSCPKCNTVIRKPLYLEKNVNSWFNNIEQIKKSVSRNKDYTNLLKGILRQRIEKKRFSFCKNSYSSDAFYACWMKLEESIKSEKGLDIQNLNSMENMINIMEISGSLRIYKNPRDHLKLTEKLKEYINMNVKWLETFIIKRHLGASEQQLKDLLWEVHRLKLINKLDELMLEIKSKDIYMNKLMDLVLTNSPFREAELAKFISVLHNLFEYYPSKLISISELEKQPVLAIMSFSVGHWFLCEKEHAYSVVKCRDLFAESNCHECDKKIVYVKPLLPKHYQPQYRPAQHRGRRRGRGSRARRPYRF
ncbi:NFX1-type zinc finger-containing protein 1 [Argiope bruennichi]|uniref:NFX1-type zinc finger-containing protein 1 n=1 Tax=Argiope bruennichi TaxID=94029 RepID=A0A8T0EV67_ARGBR|nr:NFX1-type zinc finger-containing protein 1 [Argiope bruennichi]